VDKPWGFQGVQPPRFLDSRHMKVVRLSALRTGSLYPIRKYSWYSFLLEAESTPGPITLSRTEPATFQLVAQCLNQVRHRVPHSWGYLPIDTVLSRWFCKQINTCAAFYLQDRGGGTHTDGRFNTNQVQNWYSPKSRKHQKWFCHDGWTASRKQQEVTRVAATGKRTELGKAG
jgi:hypothetical protein